MSDQYILKSVANTLDLVDLLAYEEELSLAEICKRLGMGKSAVFRMLSTLAAKDYVYKTDDAKYKLGVKFAHYGAKVIERMDIMRVARPFLRKLTDEYNETSHLAVLGSDNHIVFMGKELSNASIQMFSHVGARLPAYCTGTGKALLANMEKQAMLKVVDEIEFIPYTNHTITSREELLAELVQVRQLGYSQDYEESEVGLICYAAPVRDLRGKAVAAISLSGPSVRMLQNRDALVASVKETALEISRMLGYVG